MKYQYIPLDSINTPHIDMVIKLLLRTNYRWKLDVSGKHVMDSFTTAILVNDDNESIMLSDMSIFMLETEMKMHKSLTVFLREPYKIQRHISKVDWMLINGNTPIDMLFNRLFKRKLSTRPQFIGRNQIHHIERVVKYLGKEWK